MALGPAWMSEQRLWLLGRLDGLGASVDVIASTVLR
jgi:hypothetical protein